MKIKKKLKNNLEVKIKKQIIWLMFKLNVHNKIEVFYFEKEEKNK